MTSPDPQALTRAQSAAQAGIAAELVDVLRKLWRLLNPLDLDGTQQAWIDALVEVLGPYRARSVQSAVEFVTAVRRAEVGSTAGFRPVRAADMNLDALRVSLYATGVTPVANAVKRLALMDLDDAVKARRLSQAHEEAFMTSTAAVQRHVVNGGRETVVASVEADSRTLGWMRVSTSARPCSFCAMLISRGLVYKGQSFARSDPRFLGPGEYKAHDFDHCVLKPVYSYADPAVVASERLSDLWVSSTRGKSGKAATAAFRAAYNAR